jgi:hypothetical protein
MPLLASQGRRCACTAIRAGPLNHTKVAPIWRRGSNRSSISTCVSLRDELLADVAALRWELGSGALVADNQPDVSVDEVTTACARAVRRANERLRVSRDWQQLLSSWKALQARVVAETQQHPAAAPDNLPLVRHAEARRAGPAGPQWLSAPGSDAGSDWSWHIVVLGLGSIQGLVRVQGHVTLDLDLTWHTVLYV